MYIDTFWLIIIGIAVVALAVSNYRQYQQKKVLEEQFAAFAENILVFTALHSFRYVKEKPIAERKSLRALAHFIIVSVNRKIYSNSADDIIDTLKKILPEFCDGINYAKYNKTANSKVNLTEDGIKEIEAEMYVYLFSKVRTILDEEERKLAKQYMEEDVGEDNAWRFAHIAMSMDEDSFKEYMNNVRDILEKAEKGAVNQAKKKSPTKKRTIRMVR